MIKGTTAHQAERQASSSGRRGRAHAARGRTQLRAAGPRPTSTSDLFPPKVTPADFNTFPRRRREVAPAFGGGQRAAREHQGPAEAHPGSGCRSSARPWARSEVRSGKPAALWAGPPSPGCPGSRAERRPASARDEVPATRAVSKPQGPAGTRNLPRPPRASCSPGGDGPRRKPFQVFLQLDDAV